VDPVAAAALARAAVRDLGPGELWLEADRPADLATVARWLEQATEQPARGVVISGLGFLFDRRPGGLAPLERLIGGLLEARSRPAVILLADSAVWGWLAQATPLASVVGDAVELGPLGADDLEHALMSRHAVSGYAVDFEVGQDLAWQVQRALVRGDEADRSRKAWFRALHAASGGVLQDALRLWVASVREVDDEAERLRVGPVPEIRYQALARLPEDTLLTLLEAARQGWISAEGHGRAFRTSSLESAARLAALRNAGWLEPIPAAGPLLRVSAHVRAPLHRALARRGWA
jgi:hypothetical protein